MINKSQQARHYDSKWNDQIYDTIAWDYIGDLLRKLPIGHRIQLSKLMHDLLPTAKPIQTFDNRHDGRCFECGQLWEDTNHVLQCPSDKREQARSDAFQVLREHFQRQHTPLIMTDIICTTMSHWIQRRRITPPDWPTPSEPIMMAITRAFQSQTRIGWDQFLRGRLTNEWSLAIATYYHARQPGQNFTPEHWMQTTINAIWEFSLTLWRRRCETYHGTNGVNTLERKRKEMAIQAQAVYNETIGSNHPMTNIILHRQSLQTMLSWTKQHLDAYLATAEVLCEWNVEPG